MQRNTSSIARALRGLAVLPCRRCAQSRLHTVGDGSLSSVQAILPKCRSLTASPLTSQSRLKSSVDAARSQDGYGTSGRPSSAFPGRAAEVDKFVDSSPAHSNTAALPKLRPMEDAPEDAPMRQFSDVSHPDAVRSICHANVPGWVAFPPESIVIDQLCEGLSNQNFKVHLALEPHMLRGAPPCVLFRIYGKDSSSLYDGDLELRIVNMLSGYGIAPRIYANAKDWRIEEWHFSVPLLNRSMRNPSIFLQVAASFGRFHKLSGRADFPEEFKQMKPCSLARFDTWGVSCQSALTGFDPKRLTSIEQIDVEEMLKEREWCKKFMLADDPRIMGSGLDVVFAHWDAQENNILQTLSGLRWIDFEYSGMEYQAWDIACYFVECTVDYLVDKYPFYKVTLSDFPSEAEQRLFCSAYLSEYLETTVRPDDLAVSVLLERVKRFTLATHLLWAHWSVIRASQAPTFSEFDYLHYAQSRWFMYKWTKRALLNSS